MREIKSWVGGLVMLAVVVLSWDANTESDLVGYRIYRDGELIGQTGKDTLEFTDPQGGQIYFITAVNSSTQESLHSNVVIIGQVTIY